MQLKGENLALVAFGPSQAGKSSFVKCLREYYDVTEGEEPVLGTGNGCSSTCQATIFSVGNDFGFLADMGGWDDSQLRFTGKEMAERASRQLVFQDIRQVRFLVFDSMSSDTSQLRKSVAELVEGFGAAVKESIIVIASKMDRAEPDQIDARHAFMVQTMTELEIGNRLVRWQSKHVSKNTMAEHVDDLLRHMKNTPTVATDTMQHIRSRIETRAHHLCEHQSICKRFVDVEVEESFIKAQKVPVEHEEAYLEEEHTTTTKLAHEMQEAPGPTVTLSILSLGIYAAATYNMSHTKTVLVKKTRTVTTEETQSEQGVRTVIKQVEVEDPPSLWSIFLTKLARTSPRRSAKVAERMLKAAEDDTAMLIRIRVTVLIRIV